MLKLMDETLKWFVYLNLWITKTCCSLYTDIEPEKSDSENEESEDIMADKIIKKVGTHRQSFLGLDTTKPVFGVSEKVRLKPVFSATETS